MSKNTGRSSNSHKTNLLGRLESCGGRHLLTLGHRLLIDMAAPKSFSKGFEPPTTAEERLSGIYEATRTLKTFLRTRRCPKLRKALGMKTRQSAIVDSELRMFAYVTYCHLVGEAGHASLAEAMHVAALDDRRPDVQLEARLTCTKMINRGALRIELDEDKIAMQSCLFLTDDLMEYFVGGMTSSPLTVTFSKGNLVDAGLGIPGCELPVSREEKANREKIDAAKKADSKIRFCAWYMATKGMTMSAGPGEVMGKFAELKIRLARGSWKNLTHLMADITSRYGVAKEQMG